MLLHKSSSRVLFYSCWWNPIWNKWPHRQSAWPKSSITESKAIKNLILKHSMNIFKDSLIELHSGVVSKISCSSGSTHNSDVKSIAWTVWLEVFRRPLYQAVNILHPWIKWTITCTSAKELVWYWNKKFLAYQDINDTVGFLLDQWTNSYVVNISNMLPLLFAKQ